MRGVVSFVCGAEETEEISTKRRSICGLLEGGSGVGGGGSLDEALWWGSFLLWDVGLGLVVLSGSL